MQGGLFVDVENLRRALKACGRDEGVLLSDLRVGVTRAVHRP